MAILEQGRNPTLGHVARLGTAHGIGQVRIKEVFEQVSDAIARWPQIAGETGVSHASRNEIEQRLRDIRARFIA